MNKSLSQIKGQAGAVQFLLLFAAIAIIAFLGFSSLAPFKDKLLSVLHRKPDSFASNQTDTQYNLGVFVIKYFPLTPNGQNIDINVTGDVGEPYSFIRQKTIDATANLLVDIPKATSYLGYSDPNAQPAINLTLVDTKEYTQAVPIQSGSTNKPDLNKILTEHNICNLVDNQNVREVWLWAYQGPGPSLAISEAQLTGPYISFANGPYYPAPVCNNTYRILTFNYQRGTAEAMHSWGHLIEFEMNAIDANLFKTLWQGPNYPPILNVNGRCGSVHNPPNSRAEYDYANPNPQQSDCLDWNPDGIGALSNISCSNWGCQEISDSNNSQLNYLIWNYQNMPGRNNTKTYQGKKLRNWWDIHGDFDNVMNSQRTLFVPTPPPVTTVIINDNFDRADSAVMGNTQTGQTWENLKGTWGITSNTAFPTNGCPAPGYAVVDTGLADGVYEIKLAVNQQDLRIPFRVQDLSNLYWLETRGGNTYDINRMVNGVQSSVGQLSGATAQNGDVIKIMLQGSQITAYVNGILRLQATDSAVTGTKYGIGTWCNGAVRFDDFSFSKFEPVPSPSPSPSPLPSPSPSLIPSPSASPQTTIKLINGDFEDGNIGWLISSDVVGTLKKDGVKAFSGNISLHAKGRSANAIAQQAIQGNFLGKVLAVSGNVSVDSANAGMNLIIDMQPVDATNKNTGPAIILANYKTVTSGWVNFSTTLALPKNTTKTLFRVRFQQLNGEAFIDNLVVSAN